jgi:two-component system, OmpR family, alkaline phosphatase synthesis response regulator PhoP
MSRILLIEDQEDLAFGLKNNLEVEGHTVRVARDGHEGLRLARERSADLTILDLMLPGLSGFEVLAAIRKGDPQLPVLILTARGEEEDKVRGLRLGADDYVTKPFGLMEVLARVEALLRRTRGTGDEAGEERFGDVVLEAASRTAARGGEPVSLAPKEFDLLLHLCRNRHRVVSRLELLRSVWGYSEDAVSRTVDTHIAEIRRKLERDPARPRHILTVRKSGYRLQS